MATGSNGYRPVALGDRCNLGTEVLDGERQTTLGEVTLRGFPFTISEDPGRCFIGLGTGLASSASIPLQCTAFNLLLCHRLLDSPIMEGGPVGSAVAQYRFCYQDGTAEEVTIRDRFEIAHLPVSWGQLPFLAVPDAYDRLPPRYQGPFAAGGERQTEALQAWPHSYWLWAWRNPRPELPLRALEIKAEGPRFVIAALTIGEVDEHPLRLSAARSLRIDVDDPRLADRTPIDLEVSVDRGVATFPYTLPTQSRGAFLESPMPGFGEPVNPGSSPAYAEVSALPSARLTVRSGQESLGSVPWEEVTAGDQRSVGSARIQMVDRGRNWVRTEIVDAESGQPIPCRVHFRSSDGIPFAPHGHHAHVGSDMGTWHIDVGGDVRLGGMSYAYVNGSCEGWLPRGEVMVDIARGFEYEPLRRQVLIEPGQQHLRLELRRMRDMNAERWFSGDTHVHFLSTQGAQTEARGEDLNVVNLLLSQWGHLFTNTEEFTGEPLVSRDGRTIVHATQENRQHMLGHLTLLGLKRPVMPWCSDGPSEAEMGGSLEITMSEWADRCHEQGGTVILPHIPNPNGEPAAMVATGRVDGMEFLAGSRYNHAEYYRYLNGGYRLPLVGGTDKMSSEVPVGLYRTYVHIPDDEEFTYEAWCRNLARGRTFLSGGPLLSLRVEGALPGDTVRVAGGGTVEVEADTQSILPVHRLELVHNGRVVASSEDPKGTKRLRLAAKVTVERDGWLAARVGGPGYYEFMAHEDAWHRGLMAHTSPVYLACSDTYHLFSEQTARYMLTLVEGTLQYVREMSAQYPPGTVTHHHGDHDHIAHLSRPFLEAKSVLDERLRTHR